MPAGNLGDPIEFVGLIDQRQPRNGVERISFFSVYGVGGVTFKLDVATGVSECIVLGCIRSTYNFSDEFEFEYMRCECECESAVHCFLPLEKWAELHTYIRYQRVGTYGVLCGLCG